MELTFSSEITVSVVDAMGDDLSIAGAAKVLEPEAYRNFLDERGVDAAAGLISYLMQHRHGTPFEHNALTIYVRAPIFVWREWHRHRIGFSYNEESARYKTLAPDFYIPPRDRPMVKVDNWKAGRPKFKTLDEAVAEEFGDGVPPGAESYVREVADARYAEIVADMKDGYRDEYARYLRQLGRHIDPGLARDNLPVGIFSSCWVTCNARSLMAFLSLRTHEPEAKFVSYPLAEIEYAARKVEDIFAARFPLAYAAFCKFGRVGP